MLVQFDCLPWTLGSCLGGHFASAVLALLNCLDPRVWTLGGHFALEAWCSGWWVGQAGLHWLAACHQPVMSSRQLAPPLVSSHSSPSSLSFPSKLIFFSHFFLSLLLLSLAHILFPSKNFDIRFIHPVGQPHVHLILQFCLFLFSLSFFSCRIRGKLDNFLRTNPINEPPSPRPDWRNPPRVHKKQLHVLMCPQIPTALTD